MTDESNLPAFQPVDLSPELQRASELADLKLQRTLDKKWGIKKEENGPTLFELNARLLQYKVQFQVFSIGTLILQTVADFNKIVVPLQNKKLDVKKPVAIDRETKQPIVISENNSFEYKE